MTPHGRVEQPLLVRGDELAQEVHAHAPFAEAVALRNLAGVGGVESYPEEEEAGVGGLHFRPFEPAQGAVGAEADGFGEGVAEAAVVGLELLPSEAGSVRGGVGVFWVSGGHGVVAVARIRDYIREVKSNAQKSDNTFLTIESFAKEVQDQVFTLPKIVFNLSLWALVLSTAAILIPVLFGWYDDYQARSADREALKNRVENLEERIFSPMMQSTENLVSVDDLEARIERLENLSNQPQAESPNN